MNVANITAPAEISFAIPTRVEYLLWKTASRANSIAEFSISKPTTKPIASIIIHISARGSSKAKAHNSVNVPIKK